VFFEKRAAHLPENADIIGAARFFFSPRQGAFAGFEISLTVLRSRG
jgi:hypothetical protein